MAALLSSTVIGPMRWRSASIARVERGDVGQVGGDERRRVARRRQARDQRLAGRRVDVDEADARALRANSSTSVAPMPVAPPVISTPRS